MIVRTWHGCVPLQHAEEFARHPEQTGTDHARDTPSNRGTLVHQENQGEWVCFFLAAYQQDPVAIKAFVDEDYRIAVTYSDDDAFELLSDLYAFRHEVEAVSLLQVDDWTGGGSASNRRLLAA